MIPNDRKFARTHEWARFEDDGSVTVGITDYAVKQLGDILYIALPPVGFQATCGVPFGAVESIKTAVDILSPVSGVVIESNASIMEDTHRLEADPYGAGWMIRIKMPGKVAPDGLMSADEYLQCIQPPRT